MSNRTACSKIIYLGEEKIAGKERKHGVLSDPTAKIFLSPEISQHKLNLSPESDIGELIFKVKYSYEEATEKEDVPYFLLEIFDEKGKLIKSDEWHPKQGDTFYEDDEYGLEEPLYLTVKLNLKNYKGKIKLRAHLRCWLEESGWTPLGGGKETVSAEENVEINVDVPTIKEPRQAPTISFSVTGKKKTKEEENLNYKLIGIGKRYKIITLIINHSNNIIKYGIFKIYEIDSEENETKVQDFALNKIINNEGSTAFIHWFLESWKWYKTLSSEKLKIIDKKDRKFIYNLYSYLRDEYGFEHEKTVKTPLKELTIVVKIPEYKLDCLEAYNETFDIEESSKWWAFIEGITGSIAGGIAGFWIGGPAGIYYGAQMGGLYGLSALLGAKSVEEAAAEFRTILKKLIDDPPAFDRNYKKLVKCKIKKIKLRKPKNKYEKILQNITRSKLSIAANSKVLIPTLSRTWTAKMKGDKTVFKKQNKALRKYKGTLAKEFKSLHTNYKKFADEWKKLKIKVKRSDVLVLKNEIMRKGFPEEIKKQLRKKGYTNTRIKNLEKRIAGMDMNNIDLANTYLRFSKSLLKLSKSVKKMNI